MNRSDWTPGDENVARLLGQAYDPPSVPAEFAARVQVRLLEVAAEEARRRTPAPRRLSLRRRMAAPAAAAALLGILALGLRFVPAPPGASAPPQPAATYPQTVAAPVLAPALASVLSPGREVATGAGERRRLALSDGSVLSLNQNTTFRYDASRHLTLKAGEIFVEVAPHLADTTPPLFTVATPHRAIRAVGTKFLVRADSDGTGVAVTQGQVYVSDHDGLLGAGQQLGPNGATVTPAPRASYLLDWTRDLVVSASPALVPPSAYAGGALVAFNPQGEAAPLTLRKYHIDVHIEDGFARTTIDQTYFNHTPGRLEGTFYFPLPADASLSRLAMYVNGRLMEGGMVERDHGRTVFEQIVTKVKDPALLEWVDGDTFKMRVFPLEPRQEKRIILSYTQRLPNLYGRLSYRFPAGHSLGAVRDWSMHVRVKDGAKAQWHCDSHALTPRIENGDLLLDAATLQVTMERDITLTLSDPAGTGAARFAAAEEDGWSYLLLRYRPELPGMIGRRRRDWVFLFEASADRDPLLARTQAEVVRTLLTNAERDDTFVVLAAATQVRRSAPSPQRVTPENIAAALAFLGQTHLLGALDLDAGLTAAAELLRGSERPVLVHLGSGRPVLGEHRPEILAGRILPGTCYVGVAVGERRAPDFMRRAAERCQGHVTSINPNDPVAWDAFDLLAALNTPRLCGVRVTDPIGETQFLCPNSTLAQGEELCALARWPAGTPLPRSVRLRGTLDGSPYECELLVEAPRWGAAYLPRTWARLEIDHLLAEDARKSKAQIIALSKSMYVMTPYTSLLVLENEEMYAQYKVDRGRKDHWAMYPCPPTIPVVHEPPSQVEGAGAAFPSDPGAALAAALKRRIEPVDLLNVTIRPAGGESLGNATQWMVNPYAGYLRGTTSITEANAQYQGTIPQARVTREEARRSALQTRRAALEEAEYERAHMPSPEQFRQQQLQRELDRARVAPPLTEVWSGRSLNVLLRHLIAQQHQGAKGPNIPLNEDLLKSINVTAGDTGGNIGLLKNNGRLVWPQAVQGEPFKEAREDFAHRLKYAITTVQTNRNPDESTLNDLQADLQSLNNTLDANISSLTPDQYTEGKRYLRLLGNTVTALKDRNVLNYVNGRWAAKGKNVAELVKYMGERRLWFAPATPSDEPAYLALYHALAAFSTEMPRTVNTSGNRERPYSMLPFIADAPPTSDPEGSERLLVALLADRAQARRPALWRQAAAVAEQRGQYDTAWRRLERAWQLEASPSPDLTSLRHDCAWFLRLARKRVEKLTAHRQPVPRDLLDRVMAIADRWRAVDPEDWVPCDLAASIFQAAGERELAWGYLTTPAAVHGATVASWLELARQRHRQGGFDLAERAFAAASSLAPADAAIIWERALNHRAAGHAEDARALFRRLDEGVWEERYKPFQMQARQILNEGR